MFETIIAEEFETPVKKKKADKEVCGKAKRMSPAADEVETTRKRKKHNKKELAKRKPRCLSLKVIFIHYHMPFPLLGIEICFYDNVLQNLFMYTYRKRRKVLQRHHRRKGMFLRRNFFTL